MCLNVNLNYEAILFSTIYDCYQILKSSILLMSNYSLQFAEEYKSPDTKSTILWDFIISMIVSKLFYLPPV